MVTLGWENKIKEECDWSYCVILVQLLAAAGLLCCQNVCGMKDLITGFFLFVPFRKLPGRNVYAQMHNEKEQEMTSPVNHSEDTQNIIQGEEFIDDDLDSQTLGNARGNFIFSSYIFVSNSFLLDVHFHFSFFFFFPHHHFLFRFGKKQVAHR